MRLRTGVIASSHVASANKAIVISSNAMYYNRSSTGISNTSDMTWCCWIKLTTDPNAFQGILCLDGGGNWHYMNTTSNGTLLGRDSTAGSGNTAFNLTVGTWCFSAFVYTVSGSDVYYWADAPATTLNTLSSAAAGAVPTGITTFTIGNTNAHAEYFHGSIAAVKVWTAALSQAELTTEASKYLPQRTSGLWAAYSFSNGPQTTDDSGNGRTLTQVGSPGTDTSGPPCT